MFAEMMSCYGILTTNATVADSVLVTVWGIKDEWQLNLVWKYVGRDPNIQPVTTMDSAYTGILIIKVNGRNL